jgi:hypothetical protein
MAVTLAQLGDGRFSIPDRLRRLELDLDREY